MKFSILFLIILFISCTAINVSIKESYNILSPKHISIQEFFFITKTIPQENIILIDLRNSTQFQKSHIPKAISITYKNLETITNIPDIQEKRIILYDSKKAHLRSIYKSLEKNNLSNYQIILNGFQSWQDYQNNTNNNYI